MGEYLLKNCGRARLLFVHKVLKNLLIAAFLMVASYSNGQVTYTSIAGGNWNGSTIWSPTGVPGPGDNVIINGHTIQVGNAQSFSINDLTINDVTGEGAIRFIFGGELVVNGNFVNNAGNNGIIYTAIPSFTPIKILGAFSGDDIDYFFPLTGNGSQWHLISNPFTDNTIQNFISNVASTNFTAGSNGNIGLSLYNNNNASWEYQQTGSTGTLNPGVGMAINLKNDLTTLTFTGKPVTGNITVPITKGSSNNYNLIGNPYLSYIPVNNAANSTNILSNNSNIIDQTLWLWDPNEGASGSYITVNQVSESRFIPPLQGFFVRLLNTAGLSEDFSFTAAMQTTTATDAFLRTTAASSRPEIKFTMQSSEGNIRSFEIFYISGTTTGFDSGYDSTVFGGADQSFSIHTQLVSDNKGDKYAIQSLPNSNFETMIVPVGVNASAGTQVTFTSTIDNFPTGINVYLEDTLTNEFVNLSTLGDKGYQVVFEEEINGVGRFFMHTTSSVLSTQGFSPEHVSIYQSNQEYITITGIQDGSAQVKVYDIHGKAILNHSFQGAGVNTIALPTLSTGVYFTTITTEKGKINKKLILQ